MNTPVSFEIKQLLFNKGWRYELNLDETGHRANYTLAEQRWNEGDLTYIDITIVEVVMWIYKTHGIWVSVNLDLSNTLLFDYEIQKEQFLKLSEERYDEPTEAYSEAIKHTLTNFI